MEAMPEARLCTRLGMEIEKFGGEFKMSATQERTSRQGSLKLNYGGISTTRVRNDDGWKGSETVTNINISNRNRGFQIRG